jgi:hypothetical protein
MKACCWYGKNDVRVETVPDLRPGDNVRLSGLGLRFTADYYVKKVEQHELVGIGTAIFGSLDVHTAHPIARRLQIRHQMMTDEAARSCDQRPRLQCCRHLTSPSQTFGAHTGHVTADGGALKRQEGVVRLFEGSCSIVRVKLRLTWRTTLSKCVWARPRRLVVVPACAIYCANPGD